MFDPLLIGFPNRTAAAQCFAADILRASLDKFKKLNENSPQQIENFLALEIVGRQQNNCQLSVAGHKDVDKAVGRLKYFLNMDTETFAYSVTPKSLSQNISSSSEIRDAYDLLLHFPVGASQTETNAFVDALKDRSERIKAIVAHPFVVGFGSGRDPLEDLLGKEPNEKSTVVRKTVFGWAILPRLTEGGRLEQSDDQYALTAVISVPSWWLSVALNIETCWLPRNKVDLAVSDEASNFVTCDKTMKQQVRTVIRLPGSHEDLERKLGVEVIQEPHIDNTSDFPQNLDVYEPGSLLLSGLRLWRSTAVTMGTQLADSITVLPNMEGIIATFKCVLPQTGTPIRLPDGGFQISGVPVKVWTSEGVTEVKYVNLNVAPAEDAMGQAREDGTKGSTNEGPKATDADATKVATSEDQAKSQSGEGKAKTAGNNNPTNAQARAGGPKEISADATKVATTEDQAKSQSSQEKAKAHADQLLSTRRYCFEKSTAWTAHPN
jgi:hypothetical protein